MTDPVQTQDPARKAGVSRRPWLAGVALAAAFVAGGITLPVVTAAAQDSGMHAVMMGGGQDSEMHAKMMAHLTHMLDAAGASADQKTRIETILHTGLKPMMEAHASMGQTHATLHALLTAPVVDRAALEQLRASQIAELDQASRTMVQAMADAAEVLTPEQRAKLAAAMNAHL